MTFSEQIKMYLFINGKIKDAEKQILIHTNNDHPPGVKRWTQVLNALKAKLDLHDKKMKSSLTI